MSEIQEALQCPHYTVRTLQRVVGIEWQPRLRIQTCCTTLLYQHASRSVQISMLSTLPRLDTQKRVYGTLRHFVLLVNTTA